MRLKIWTSGSTRHASGSRSMNARWIGPAPRASAIGVRPWLCSRRTTSCGKAGNSPRTCTLDSMIISGSQLGEVPEPVHVRPPVAGGHAQDELEAVGRGRAHTEEHPPAILDNHAERERRAGEGAGGE